MTTAQMLAKVRTLLDEDTAGNWTDDEIYLALSSAQLSIVTEAVETERAKSLLSSPNRILQNLVEKVTGSSVSNSVSAPSDFLDMLSAKWAASTGGTKYRCQIRGYNANAELYLNNSYLSPTTKFPIAYWYSISDAKTIVFLPSGTGDYELFYIQTPPTLSASQESILPADLHDTLVKAAYADMIEKYRGGKFG